MLKNTECPVTFNNEAVRANIAKVKRLDEILLKEKQSEFEEIRNKARFLINEPSITGTSDIIDSQKKLEIDWEKLNQTVSVLKEWNGNAQLLLEGKSFFLFRITNLKFPKFLIFTGVANLDKWLTQKERMMSAIGTVNVDSKVLDNQLIQLEVFHFTPSLF